MSNPVEQVTVEDDELSKQKALDTVMPPEVLDRIKQVKRAIDLLVQKEIREFRIRRYRLTDDDEKQVNEQVNRDMPKDQASHKRRKALAQKLREQIAAEKGPEPSAKQRADIMRTIGEAELDRDQRRHTAEDRKREQEARAAKRSRAEVAANHDAPPDEAARRRALVDGTLKPRTPADHAFLRHRRDEQKKEMEKPRDDLLGYGGNEKRAKFQAIILQNKLHWHTEYEKYAKQQIRENKHAVTEAMYNYYRQEGRMHAIVQMVRFHSRRWHNIVTNICTTKGFPSIWQKEKTYPPGTRGVLSLAAPAECIWEHLWVWNPTESPGSGFLAMEDIDRMLTASTDARKDDSTAMWRQVKHDLETVDPRAGFVFLLEATFDPWHVEKKGATVRYVRGVVGREEEDNPERIVKEGPLKSPPVFCGACGWYVMTTHTKGCGRCDASSSSSSTEERKGPLVFCSPACKNEHMRENHPDSRVARDAAAKCEAAKEKREAQQRDKAKAAAEQTAGCDDEEKGDVSKLFSG